MALNHHVSDELLVAYEAGTLAEGWSLAVATHLALCPVCRKRATAAAAVGGALLETIEMAAVDELELERVMDRIASTEIASPQDARAKVVDRPAPVIPEPLRSFVGGDIDSIAWRRLGMSARHLPLRTRDGKTSVRLLRIPAGESVPLHGHRGMELTVVLTGRLVDGTESFGRGDIEEANESIEHQPVAGPEAECICLAVTDAPLRFRRLLVRLAQPFLGI